MALGVLRVTLKIEDCELLIPSLPYPMYPWPERLNYIAIDSASGKRHIFNYGPTRVNASIIWKSVNYDLVKRYEDFILNKIKFGLHPFKIICPEYLPLGLGKGVDIPNAYFSGSSDLRDIISLRGDAGLYYDIELPYMFVRSN
ncbi:MAG: hypothetical protein FWB90_02820 [Fibromonadales bacterium]|nr:hypothetical protein [Fibromonadales bacterium]